MITFRAFNKTDWYGFAGCLPFDGDVEPVLANMKMVDNGGFADAGDVMAFDALVVLDSQGLFVQAMQEGDDEGLSERSFACEYPLAARAVAMLRDGMSFAELTAMPGVVEVSS